MKKIHFTLIELMLVITIIVILASMLMPALRMTREKARGLDCTGKLKGIGLANNMYCSDYNDYFPVKGSGFAGSALPAWSENLSGNGYMVGDKAKLFRCASKESNPVAWNTAISYGTNWRNYENTAEWNDYANRRELKIASRYVTHADTIYYPGHAKWPNQAYSFGWKKTREGVVQVRHSDKANVLMGDGHTASLKIENFKINSLSYGIKANDVTEIDTTL